jgi:16S rRNA (cytidine1402-2'-O)-methyltransferase
MAFGSLYMVPVTLGDDNLTYVIPADVMQLVQGLEYFVVENEKSARRFLGSVKTHKPVRELSFQLLNEHSAEKDLPTLIAPLLAGHDVGMLSEAGCPGIADPGATLAALAHRKGIKVVPLVGPSSILLGLMASGFNGQQFTFLGYLPSDKTARVNKLKEIEKQSQRLNETQIFIETPYRNQHMLEDILASCAANSKLCIARNVSLESEFVVSKTIAEWKKSELPDLHKQPTVFLLLA